MGYLKMHEHLTKIDKVKTSITIRRQLFAIKTLVYNNEKYIQSESISWSKLIDLPRVQKNSGKQNNQHQTIERFNQLDNKFKTNACNKIIIKQKNMSEMLYN